jgi:hypothetical protein
VSSKRYVTHHVSDLEKDTVRQLLEPLFVAAPGEKHEPVDPLALEAYLLAEQGKKLK